MLIFRLKGWSRDQSFFVFCFLQLVVKSFENKTHTQFEAERIKAILLKHQIIPDVLYKPKAPLPQRILKVSYGNTTVDFGTPLYSLEIDNPPTFIQWPTKKGAMYSLIVVGPDMPSIKEPSERNWLHWAVGNIPGCNVSAGKEITPYDGLNLSYELGPHRIVFLVYQQPTDSELYFLETEFTKKMDFFRRAFYNPYIFVERYKLLGPLAVNFMTGKWENETPNISSIYTDL